MTPARERRPAWLEAAHQRALDGSGDEETARARVVAGVVVAVARASGVSPPLGPFERWGSPVDVGVPSASASAWSPGRAHELLLDRAARRRGGAFYTPRAVADVVVDWAIAGAAADADAFVVDPAVGGAAFLLAAAEALERATGQAREAIVGRLAGIDVDPVAAATAEAALTLWSRGRGRPTIETGDALLDDDAWPARAGVVVGNPPFLGQLSDDTTRTGAAEQLLRERLGPSVATYTDTATLFLVRAAGLVAPGGRVGFVVPTSVLAARDAGGARGAVAELADIEVVWMPGRDLFAAGARVAALVVRRHPAAATEPGPTEVRRYAGVPPVLVDTVATTRAALAAAPTWSHLAAGAAAAVPIVVLDAAASLGSMVDATAGFRDEYYGIGPYVVDDEAGALDDEGNPRLVTAGLLDPAVCHWGSRPARYLGRRWTAPRLDLARLPPASRVGRWARARLVPKVVVAPQARVIEAAVDESGCWLPSTPVVAVAAPPEQLWHVAAALLAPPVSAWAARTWAGTGLAHDSVRVGAAQVRAVPLPVDRSAWDDAATAVRTATRAGEPHARRAALLVAGAAACRAYRAGDDVLAWWAARLPPVVSAVSAAPPLARRP